MCHEAKNGVESSDVRVIDVNLDDTNGTIVPRLGIRVRIRTAGAEAASGKI